MDRVEGWQGGMAPNRKLGKTSGECKSICRQNVYLEALSLVLGQAAAACLLLTRPSLVLWMQCCRGTVFFALGHCRLRSQHSLLLEDLVWEHPKIQSRVTGLMLAAIVSEHAGHFDG